MNIEFDRKRAGRTPEDTIVEDDDRYIEYDGGSIQEILVDPCEGDQTLVFVVEELGWQVCFGLDEVRKIVDKLLELGIEI